MPNIKFKVDTRAFDAAVSEYLIRVPMAMDEAITLRMRRLLQRVSKLLPPKSSAQGRKRVGKDLFKAARFMGQDAVQNPALKRILQEQDIASLQAVVDRSSHPKLVGRTVVPFSERLHKDARGSDGRVEDDQKLLIPGHKEWKRYAKTVQADVGKLKGSIISALSRVGGRVPKWIAKHSSQASIRDFRQDRKNPTFVVTSKVPWSGNYQWVTRYAYRAEERAMMADLRKRLKYAANRARLS